MEGENLEQWIGGTNVWRILRGVVEVRFYAVERRLVFVARPADHLIGFLTFMKV